MTKAPGVLMSLDRTVPVTTKTMATLITRYQQRPWLYAIERTKLDTVAVQRVRGDWACLIIHQNSPFWAPMADVADGYTPAGCTTLRRTDDDCDNCCVCSGSCPQAQMTSQCCPDCFDHLYPA